MLRIVLICCMIALSIPVSTITVGNMLAEYQREITTEETMDSVILNKYVKRDLVHVAPTIYRDIYFVECLGKVDGPSITFEVGSETYNSVEVGTPLRLAVLYEGDKLYDIRLVERNGNVVSCLNRID